MLSYVMLGYVLCYVVFCYVIQAFQWPITSSITLTFNLN